MNTIEKTKEQRIEATLEPPLTVCFVCTGNTCRSPMAAALLNDRTRIPPICSMCDLETLLNTKKIRATSAGLYATGAPIAQNAVAALEKAGIRSLPDNPYKEHLSKTLEPELMERYDRIIGMTSAHAMSLMVAFPEYASKISCMPKDIPDPFGLDEATYDACLAEIEKGIVALFFGEDEHENGHS